jgi:thiol-disulfide isomerase/thioredoxin
MPQRRKAVMKKRLYILISVLVIVLAIIIVIYGLRESKDSVSAGMGNEVPQEAGVPPIKTEVVDKKSAQLFEEMGVVKMDPVDVPAEISLPDLNGNYVNLTDFKGKILFVNFWATWCPPCREEMPSMQKLHDRLKDKDFLMVAIDLQEPVEPVKRYLKEYKFTFLTLLDANGDVGLFFGIRSIPTTLIMNKQGKIIGVAIGARDWASKKSIALFEHLIEQEVELSS